jgi:hypothetical protein
MKAISITLVVGLAILAAGLIIVSAGPAYSLPLDVKPSTVFVYNGTTDSFNSNAQGYIFQQMGLLDPNTGQPPTVQGNNLVNGSGQVVGTVIRNAQNQIIGYRSSDGTKEAYDVSAGATTAQAWGRVAKDGELHIVKHGAFYRDEDGIHQGGGIHLDSGTIYDGFDVQGGTGTGVGYGDANGANGPYPLPARPVTDNIKLNLNSCWSAKDPDGTGPAGSVTGSASNVPGVGSTQGHQGKVQARVQVQLTGGTAAQQQAGWNALIAAARAAGFRDADGKTGTNEVANWLSSLSFMTQHSTAQGVVDNAVPPPGTVKVKLSYSKQEETDEGGYARAAAIDDVGEGGYSVMPVYLRIPGAPLQYIYGADWPCVDPSCIPSAWLYAPPGSVVSPTMFHIDQVGVPPLPLPPNQVVDSGMMDFYIIGAPPPPFVPPLQITLRYFDDLGPLAVYRYDGVTPNWQQVPITAQDTAQYTVTVDAPTLSVYVVLMGVHPGLEIGPPTAAGEGYPDRSVSYTLRVTNTGDYTDTIDLATGGVWTPYLSTLVVPSLGPNLSEIVTLTVDIPLVASSGTSDTAVVTATSTISPALSRTAKMTTTALMHKIYIPIVLKDWGP